LHFGVASDTSSIRLETQALNVCRASLDAAGLLPLAATLCEGPPSRAVTIDLPTISERLRSGGRAFAVSDDAGGYLCNAVLYASLAEAEARGNGRAGFVHIPSDLSQHHAFDATLHGALDIIRASLTEAAELRVEGGKG
jgi:pyroglutamyl-peptidase